MLRGRPWSPQLRCVCELHRLPAAVGVHARDEHHGFVVWLLADCARHNILNLFTGVPNNVIKLNNIAKILRCLHGSSNLATETTS